MYMEDSFRGEGGHGLKTRIIGYPFACVYIQPALCVPGGTALHAYSHTNSEQVAPQKVSQTCSRCDGASAQSFGVFASAATASRVDVGRHRMYESKCSS